MSTLASGLPKLTRGSAQEEQRGSGLIRLVKFHVILENRVVLSQNPQRGVEVDVRLRPL